MGDGHAAMGSGEIGGTGVEASLNARIRWVGAARLQEGSQALEGALAGGRAC